MSIVFEYNEAKSAANRRKHGIDFEEAQALWEDENGVELPSKNPSEQRSLVIGMIDDKCWTAIVTYRDKNVRLISVRRSREKEIDAYEKINQKTHYSH